MNELTDLKEAYERIEWQIKHDLDNYDKDPTVAGLMDLERIKVAIDELQSYKDKEDRLREYVSNIDNWNWKKLEGRTNQINRDDVLQILNEGSD